MKAPAVKRGEIWLVDFHPSRGSEQKGVRPALVLQNDVGNQYAATTIVAAITTTIRRYPVTVVLNRGEGGLKEQSMVNLTQILTLDKSRLIKRHGALSPERLKEVDAAVRASLSIGD